MMWDEYDTLNFNKLKAVKEYYEPQTRLNNVNMHHSYCYETWRQFTELDEYEQYVCDWIAHNKCGVLSVGGNEQKSRDCRVASSSQRRDFCSRSRSGVSCSPAANKSNPSKTRRNKGERERFAEYRGLPLMSRDEFERVNEGLEPAVPAPGMDCRVARSSQRRENLGNDGTPKIEGTVIIKGQKWRIEVW